MRFLYDFSWTKAFPQKKVNLKDIPYAILYLWNENQQREQFEDFDYLGMSVGEFPLKHSGEVDPMNIFNVGGKNYQWLVNIGKVCYPKKTYESE